MLHDLSVVFVVIALTVIAFVAVPSYVMKFAYGLYPKQFHEASRFKNELSLQQQHDVVKVYKFLQQVYFSCCVACIILLFVAWFYFGYGTSSGLFYVLAFAAVWCGYFINAAGAARQHFEVLIAQ